MFVDMWRALADTAEELTMPGDEGVLAVLALVYIVGAAAGLALMVPTTLPLITRNNDMKDDAASSAGRAFGAMLNELGVIHRYRARRADTILDAYIRSGETGRSYQEERDALLAERGLGKIED